MLWILIGIYHTQFSVAYSCKARGYAYAKIEYVSVRTYLSKIEYAYDTFHSVR